jgi:hypothetical protein
MNQNTSTYWSSGGGKGGKTHRTPRFGLRYGPARRRREAIEPPCVVAGGPSWWPRVSRLRRSDYGWNDVQ